MDRRIIFIIAGLVLIALGIGTCKFLTKKSSGGKPVFEVAPRVLIAGDAITFSDNTPDAKSWEWKFGDDDDFLEKSGTHTYKEAGNYMLVLTVDGKLTDSVKIVVNEPVEDTTAKVVVQIDGPEATKVGVPVSFTDNTPGATVWHWKFGESGREDGNTQTVKYTYNTPGTYEVVVTNDKSTSTGRKKIIVTPKPMAAAPAGGGGGGAAAPSQASIEADIKAKLQTIADGGFDKVYDGMVKKYFGGSQSVPVKINGGRNKDFFSYCQNLNIVSGQKIISVTVVKDASTGYVSQVNVTQQ